MKCGAYVVRNAKGKVKKWFSPCHFKVHGHVLDKEAELCNGEIKVKVQVSNDCPCCSTPHIEIEYCCTECGCTYYGELPQSEEELSAFLTQAIARLTESQRKKMIGVRIEEKKRFDEMIIAGMEKFDAMMKK